MNRFVRTASFLVLTAIGIFGAHLVASTGIGVLGAIAVFAALSWSYRLLRRRLDGAAPARYAAEGVLPETLWSVFAACCMLGGGLAGLLAYNPDGYMQPRPAGPPWELILAGTAAGAVVGIILVALLALISRRFAERALTRVPDAR